MSWVTRITQYAGYLLPDINPNRGMPLDACVPVIPETDLTTRPFSGPRPQIRLLLMSWVTRITQYAGNLLPDINPNCGLPLDVYVPVTPEPDPSPIGRNRKLSLQY